MAELALDLDHRAITLLRRAADGGWDPVADAPLDAPDLDARLRGLHGAAVAPGGDQAVADLVIPASQISLLDLELEDDAGGWAGLDAPARRAAVSRSLERLTGRDAGALAFDWHGEPPRLRLAVVTVETLREAEAFARGYGFGAARFRAWPDPEAGFPAAADFGPAEGASAAPVGLPPAEPGPAAPRAAERVVARPAPEREAPSALPSPADEAEALTVFGARGARPERGGRGPRRAVLAGGIAAALAIAAAAALTLMPGEGGPEIEAGAVEEGARVAQAPGASPSPEPRPFAAEPVVVPVPPAGSSAQAPAPPEEAEEDARRAAAKAAPPAEATEADRARASYAATGIWRGAPAAPAPPEPREVTAPAPPAQRAEAALLAAASPAPSPEARLDASPAAMPPLPPPGAGFELSEDGRVEATPEGAPTPDGIVVYAAAPPRRPPARPPETVLPPGEAFQDPALADARPRARPEEAVVEVAETPARPAAGGTDAAVDEAVAEEAAAAVAAAPALTLPPITPGGPALAGAALAGGAADDATSASLFRAPDALPQVTVAGTTIIEETTASAFAVAASQRPYARPGDLAPPPQAAPAPPTAASTAAAVTVRRVAAAPAAPAPVAAPSAAPEIPTRASVARRATVENALRLNRLSLVGVFGAEGARRALVRLPSGRFEKVKVGDRIDGGRVRAIDDGRLIYARGGRNVALEMPRD